MINPISAFMISFAIVASTFMISDAYLISKGVHGWSSLNSEVYQNISYGNNGCEGSSK
ncbi:hypothetical protein M316_0075 [Nitrincola phage 1M3-16]|uniref:hypothetical protein n=1 Tax=Nitrincola phage 1M3-16 TaxID=1472912 RepID=UPI000444AB67|nr:hypothetical protein GJ22_gp077 [Nitrincola phage 1M3-16]AHX01140.1 hypothetical protein M316_0075 [Nitrincola phage 1M3-16]